MPSGGPGGGSGREQVCKLKQAERIVRVIDMNFRIMTKANIFLFTMKKVFSFQQSLLVRLRRKDRPETLESKAILDLLYSYAELPTENHLKGKLSMFSS